MASATSNLTLAKQGRTTVTLVSNDQLWFQHPEMQARIAQSEVDFAAGREARTESPGPARPTEEAAR